MTRDQARRAKVGERVTFLGRKDDEGFVLAVSPAGVKVRWASGIDQTFSGVRVRSIEPVRPTIGVFTWMNDSSSYLFGWGICGSK